MLPIFFLLPIAPPPEILPALPMIGKIHLVSKVAPLVSMRSTVEDSLYITPLSILTCFGLSFLSVLTLCGQNPLFTLTLCSLGSMWHGLALC